MNVSELVAVSVESLLTQALAAGAFRLGEIRVERLAGDGCELRHHLDAGQAPDGLEVFDDAEKAAEIARYTDAGEYRPLKTAPNLRRGWRLSLVSPAALRLALDFFYPGRLGALLAFAGGRLQVTSLRETLGRQSGMYRVTQKLSESQADALIGRFCRSDGGCLRTILWHRDEAGTVPSTELPEAKYDPRVNKCGGGNAAPESAEAWLPLLCQEACNLLVAEARRVVKGEV